MRIVLSLIVAVVALAAAALDDLFSGLATTETPGLAVLVRQDGRTTYQRGFGVRDLRSRTPIDNVTDFRLASFTKQFTATAIMLLVHDGKLRHGTTLTEVFPDFPAWGRGITV